MTRPDCAQCGGKITSRHKTAIFCSGACRAASRVIPRTACPVCGKPADRIARQIHCSKECHSESMRRPKTLLPRRCEGCGATFQPKKDGGRRFCGRDCSAKANGLKRRKPEIRTVRGYIQVYRPGNPMASAYGYVMQHRLVMSEVLGRPLLKEEVVHHLNGVKDDNDPKNLVLMTKADHDNTPRPRRSPIIECPHCAGKIKLSNVARTVVALSNE